MPDGLWRCIDYTSLASTCRSCDVPYVEGNFTIIVDGFLVSDNVTCQSVTNVETGFVYSDHDPVRRTFVLEDEMDERLEKQIAFILEVDKLKTVVRQTHITGFSRKENDAEHAWHMALMAYLLAEHSNRPIDVGRVMVMCLIHDIVEIDAGDTYAYDTAGLATQKARETAAKERIYALLPPDQGKALAALFEEFEAGETAEAQFARAMDNLQPLLLNHSNNGGDWREHDVVAAQVYARQRRTEPGSATLYQLTQTILEEHIKKGNLKQ